MYSLRSRIKLSSAEKYLAIGLVVLATIYFSYIVIHSYSLVFSNNNSDQSIVNLKQTHQTQLNNVLIDLRKQIDRETDLTRELNNKNKQTFVLEQQVEALQQQIKQKQDIIDQFNAQSIKESTNPSAQTPENKPLVVHPAPANSPAATPSNNSPAPAAAEPANVVIAEQHIAEQLAANSHGLSPEKVAFGVPVLVFTYDRSQNLKKTLDSLFQHQPATGHPIFVSQQDDHQQVTQVINSYGEKLYHLKYKFVQGDLFEPRFAGYYKIAAHYKFALTQIFDVLHYEKLIIVEDDFQISPDFYDYFSAMEAVLDRDSSIYCVSAWNDNGQEKFVSSPNQFYRTDCFPGLGWMLRRELWTEMSPKWPQGFWDDWLREPAQRNSRSCIYPEINRVYTFGAEGASAGQFFEQYLRPIQLNQRPVNYGELDLKYLAKNNYDVYLFNLLANATIIKDVGQVNDAPINPSDPSQASEFLLSYQFPDKRDPQNPLLQLTELMNSVGLMSDHKARVPRGSYKGIIPFRKKDNHGRVHRVWLVPGNLQISDLIHRGEFNPLLITTGTAAAATAP
jgi:alpha-1,3-mannosyl-glycoprotein beta-1,2-N-acetylglucosaminyltransferase